MSDYFFQQPDEEEKREYLRMELERMRQQGQEMPVPPAQQSPPIGRGSEPTPIGGLTIQPEEGQMSEEELRLLMEMLITGQQ